MAEITTLINDVRSLLSDILSGETVLKDEDRELLKAKLARAIGNGLEPRTKKREEKTLYASEVGKQCLRQLWYDLYATSSLTTEELETIEAKDPNLIIRLLYGNILEEVVLFLAELAGHEVKEEQRLVVKELPRGWTLRGRMDAVIDGVPIDVKSASPYAIAKFKQEDGLFHDDPFGYLAQLGIYLDDTPSSVGGFLVIDKSNGEVLLSYYDDKQLKRAEPNYEEIIDALEQDTPPPRAFSDKPVGKGGNRGLVKECQYCPYKNICWPGLRKFQYSGFVGYLTKVVKEPNVDEIKS
jgi:CRISPR/Cas system-associated exonuclease Cas4 (RecB family)